MFCLQEHLAQQLGAIFNVVDGFIVSRVQSNFTTLLVTSRDFKLSDGVGVHFSEVLKHTIYTLVVA